MEVSLSFRVPIDVAEKHGFTERPALPPATELAWFHRGNCLEQLGELRQAQDSYLAALDTDPFGISSYERLAFVARRLGDSDLADWADWAAAALA